MEHTRSLTADRDSSWASMVTLSRVRPIWSRNETVCTEPLEFVSDGAPQQPLESRADSPVLGLEHGEGVGSRAETVAGNTDFWADGGELFADICLSLIYKNSHRCFSNGLEEVFRITAVKKWARFWLRRKPLYFLGWGTHAGDDKPCHCGLNAQKALLLSPSVPLRILSLGPRPDLQFTWHHRYHRKNRTDPDDKRNIFT